MTGQTPRRPQQPRCADGFRAPSPARGPAPCAEPPRAGRSCIGQTSCRHLTDPAATASRARALPTPPGRPHSSSRRDERNASPAPGGRRLPCPGAAVAGGWGRIPAEQPGRARGLAQNGSASASAPPPARGEGREQPLPRFGAPGPHGA